MREVIEIERCSGHCCRDFTLPEDPDQLRKHKKDAITEYKKWVKQFDTAKRSEETIKFLKSDIMLVPDMVIYIDSLPFDINGEEKNELYHHYTCKHFNPETGDCINHEERPRMCRDFPYEGAYSTHHFTECPFKGCTRKVKFIEEPVPEFGEICEKEKAA